MCRAPAKSVGCTERRQKRLGRKRPFASVDEGHQDLMSSVSMSLDQIDDEHHVRCSWLNRACRIFDSTETSPERSLSPCHHSNFVGPVLLTMELLPRLCSQPEAAVIMMSSGLAFVPRAAAPTYGATKAAIHSWTMSLRHQLRNTKVEVVEIVPPLVATNFAPGQTSNPNAMALDALISEAIEILCADETLNEVLVQRALPQRTAESSGNFDVVFSQINSC